MIWSVLPSPKSVQANLHSNSGWLAAGSKAASWKPQSVTCVDGGKAPCAVTDGSPRLESGSSLRTEERASAWVSQAGAAPHEGQRHARALREAHLPSEMPVQVWVSTPKSTPPEGVRWRMVTLLVTTLPST